MMMRGGKATQLHFLAGDRLTSVGLVKLPFVYRYLNVTCNGRGRQSRLRMG